ncbi:MAG: ABC transporter ATP-binding protein [Bacteroidia bacterium]
MRSLRHVNKYFLKYKRHFIFGLIFAALSNLFAVFPAQSVRVAINLVQQNLDVYKLFEGSEMQPAVNSQVGYVLLYFSGLVLLFAVIKGLFMFFMRQTLIVMSRHIEYDMKNEIYTHYQKLSLSFYRVHSTGDLMARISEDVGRVRMYIGPAIMYSMNLAGAIVVVLWAMFSVNAKLSSYVLLPLPFLSYSIFVVNNIIHKKSDAIQSQLSKVNSFVQQAYSGIRVIKSFAVEKYSEEDFQTYADEYKKRSLSLAKVDATFFPLMVFLTGLSNLITIFIGGMMVISGEISIGNIAEFVIYINLLTWPVAAFGVVISMTQRAAASQDRITEFLNTKPGIVSENTGPFRFDHSIEFRNVSFRYPEKTAFALKNISFKIDKGETLAILGRTGSGKSTIVQLLLRMMDATEGEILIDQKNIKDVNLESFRELTGYVPQDVFLFSDTLSNNIAFAVSGHGKNLEQDVKEATDDAALTSNIADFPEGLNTLVGERGVTLSGGQKQRVSIARALIKKPELLILDDCLSAVDNKTESEILENLKPVLRDKTAVIISHRVSSVKDANRILVIDNGQIAETGSHEELMKQPGLYASLYQRQLLEEAA